MIDSSDNVLCTNLAYEGLVGSYVLPLQIDSNYYCLPLGRMARTETPHNQERRPRRTDGRGERRTVAETVGREGRREELARISHTFN